MNEPIDFLAVKMTEAEMALGGNFDETVATKPWMLDLVTQRRTEALLKAQPQETAHHVVKALEERGIVNGKHPPSRTRKATVGTGIGAGAVGIIYLVQDLLRAIISTMK